MPPAGSHRTWTGLHAGPLPLAEVSAWVVTDRAGAVVTFTGTVRDHAPGRDGVSALTYEAYEEPARRRLAEVAEETLAAHPEVGRVAIHHRVGRLEVGEPAVVVAVSSPHREAAFAAARDAIDVTKATVPLWKHEVWADGEGWGTDATPLAGVGEVSP